MNKCIHHEIANFQGLKMECYSKICSYTFATEVTAATQQMSVLADETCGCERVSWSQVSNMSRLSVSM